MTTFSRVLLLAPCALYFLMAGCAQQSAEPTAESPVAVVIAPQPVNNPTPESKAQPKPPAPPPPTFPFPADQAGKAITRVVTPDISKPLPAERFGTAPKPRTVPAKVLNPDVLPPADSAPPPLLPGKPVAPNPTPPQEQVPHTLGWGADELPTKPALAVAPVVTERARDVNFPPPAPTLGRPATDRVSLDDPTTEFGNAEVVTGKVKVPLAPSGFFKAVIPDPFELGEQVKPKVPPTAEPSTAPVPVNPQRVR